MSSKRPQGGRVVAGAVKAEPAVELPEPGDGGVKSSKFKGVHWDKTKSKWVGYIHMRGKKHHLGYFTDQESAARAYDIESMRRRGFTKNFPCTEYTPQQLAQASDGRKGIEKSSRFTGVSWNKLRRKWAARIIVDGRSQHLGHFADEAEAAKAYDRVSLAFRGCTKNFPVEAYDSFDSAQDVLHAGVSLSPQGSPGMPQPLLASMLPDSKHFHMPLSHHLLAGMPDMTPPDRAEYSNGSDTSLESDDTCIVNDRHGPPYDDGGRFHLPRDLGAMCSPMDHYPSSSGLPPIHGSLAPLGSYLEPVKPMPLPPGSQPWINPDMALASMAPVNAHTTNYSAGFSGLNSLIPTPPGGAHPQIPNPGASLFMAQCSQQPQPGAPGAFGSKPFPFAHSAQPGFPGLLGAPTQIPNVPLPGMLHLHHLGGPGGGPALSSMPVPHGQVPQLQAWSALKTTVLPYGAAMYMNEKDANAQEGPGRAMKRLRVDAGLVSS